MSDYATLLLLHAAQLFLWVVMAVNLLLLLWVLEQVLHEVFEWFQRRAAAKARRGPMARRLRPDFSEDRTGEF